MAVPTPIPPAAPSPVPGLAYPMPVGPMGLPPGAIVPYPPYPKIPTLLLKDKNDQESDESCDDIHYERSGKSYHKHFRRLMKLSKTRIPLNSLSDHMHHKIKFSNYS